MRIFAVAVLLSGVVAPTATGQQLADLIPSPTGIAPSDPSLSGIILDTVVPMSSVSMLIPSLPLPSQTVGSSLELFAPASGLSFDGRTNSVFRWSQLASGRAGIRATNLRTGSMWYGTIRPSGQMSGFDSDLNFWRYDLKSGIYINTTTGETCTGHGLTGACGP